MPSIDNKTNSLLQGLSDFWTRFYADTDELEAMYRGTEVLMAQAYLDMLSSFLNISIVETPLFNKELFKLIAIREDQVLFDLDVNPSNDRHRFDLPDNLVEAHILQNKVIDPTASLEIDSGYEIDSDELELRFGQDPAGFPGRVLGATEAGNLLTFGTGGDLKRFYVTSGTPFALAKPGHWVKIQNSGAGNNATYKVARVIDNQAVLLQPGTSTTLTTPDPNTGSLLGELIDSDFTPETGFAHRVVQVEVGGSFDDPTIRQTKEVESWYPLSPVGAGVRKGDIIRILDGNAVPSVPLDFTVALVRHEKLYLTSDNPAEIDATGIAAYVILREGPDPDIVGELQTFAQTGTVKRGNQASILAGGDGTPAQASEEVILETTATTLVSTDRQRFVTLRNSAPVTWTASLAADGTLTRTAGPLNTNVRSAANGSLVISGSGASPTNNGTYTIESILDDDTVVLVGQVFVPETGLTVTLSGAPVPAFLEVSEGSARLDLVAVNAGAAGNAITFEIATPAGGSTVVNVVGTAITVTPQLGGDTVINIVNALANDVAAALLVTASEGTAGNITLAQAATNLIGGSDSMTNNGTYRIKKVLNDHQLVLDLQMTYADPNNGSIYWDIHDGYQVTLSKTRIQRESVRVFAGVGDSFTGGHRAPIENTDYTVNYETGAILQIGRHAGTWGVVPQAYFNYSWLTEVIVVTAGAGVLDKDDTTISVNEVAMWAPDALVDRFNLYNNYGYLIDRFEASSETYREFIRGVFQLYILGPTLERLESALNVIAGFPVIRDDGELLTGWDTTDPSYNIVTTLRANGDTATYQFPKTLAMRADIQLSANLNSLTFESFEPLTLAFKTSDHVEDPSWWTDIIIPLELMPDQPVGRRRTVSALIENILGAWDAPQIGDPGFFIGADDEGNVPSFIGTYPAKRRKMANVVMERFLRWNIFFVRFDQTVIGLLDPDFVEDLLDLILVAKPGYRFLFIEPFNNFEDTMLLQENTVDITGTVNLDDEAMVVGEDTLTIQSFSWNIGDVWRAATPITGQALVVADGIGVPNSGSPIALGVQNIISKFLWVGGTSYVAIQEDVDYDIDYVAGTLTPKTIWPAGTYTIDIRNLVLTAAAGANPALGDTPRTIGGLDPQRVRNRRERFSSCTITTVSGRKVLTCSGAGFVSSLHDDAWISIFSSSATTGLVRILRVLSATQVVLYPDGVSDSTDVVWAFRSEEPLDGRFFASGGDMVFESASAIFLSRHKGRYIRVKDAVNGANNKRHLITEILSMGQVVVATGPIAETDLHWRLEGTEQHMDLVERPLQITVT